jgi:hypothetical protein
MLQKELLTSTRGFEATPTSGKCWQGPNNSKDRGAQFVGGTDYPKTSLFDTELKKLTLMK